MILDFFRLLGSRFLTHFWVVPANWKKVLESMAYAMGTVATFSLIVVLFSTSDTACVKVPYKEINDNLEKYPKSFGYTADIYENK